MKGIVEIKDPANFFRKERATVCFPIINRGKLWYDTLTPAQLGELKSWYWKWLDAPKTLEYPVMPEWLKDSIKEEEVIL